MPRPSSTIKTKYLQPRRSVYKTKKTPACDHMRRCLRLGHGGGRTRWTRHLALGGSAWRPRNQPLEVSFCGSQPPARHAPLAFRWVCRLCIFTRRRPRVKSTMTGSDAAVDGQAKAGLKVAFRPRSPLGCEACGAWCCLQPRSRRPGGHEPSNGFPHVLD